MLLSFFFFYTISKMKVTEYSSEMQTIQHAFKIDGANIFFNALENIFESLFSPSMADFLNVFPKEVQMTATQCN